MTANDKRRVMIIGLDGATLDLIRPWAEQGVLPTFRRLLQTGAHGTLRTIRPPITPTAWSSFLTGMNPGKHGLYDFTGHKKNSYETYVLNASHRHGVSLWKLISEAGYRVIVNNVPLTYPVERVNGLMVGGLLTPAGAKDGTYPRSLQEELEQAIPEFNFSPPGMFSSGQELQFVKDVRSLTETTLKVTGYLMNREPWDFMVTIFMSSDIMSHFMWRNMELGAKAYPEEQRAVLANAIKDCYRDLDTAVSILIQEAGEETNVIVMSDHGFGPMEAYMSVNAWLIDRGYIRIKQNPISQLRFLLYRLGFTPLNVYALVRKLQLTDTARKTGRKNANLIQLVNKNMFLSFRDVDWSRTRAYSNGYAGPIFVNLQGREPQGSIRRGAEYDRVLSDLTADLRQLKEPGTDKPFVGEIYRGSEVYHGNYMDQAPDILFFPSDWKYAGLGLVEFPTNQLLTPSPDRSGHHRMEGLVFLSGPGIKPGSQLQDASIMDIAPTALALMGIPIPQEMDGRVLKEAMLPELERQLTVTYRSANGHEGEEIVAPELSEEDEETIRERLANLGYIDG